MGLFGSLSGLDDKIIGGAKSAWNDWTGKSAVEMQNEYNMKMWKLQQEYNTPANQMKRYREAGLNPNLVYGGSGQMAGNATSAPEMTAHQGSAAKAIGLLETLIGLKGQVESQNLEKVKTMADISHSNDVLNLEAKKLVMDEVFRNRDFNARQSNADRDYELRKAAHLFQKEKSMWERDYISKRGVKPGSMVGYLDALLGSTLGKPTTDVMSDTGNLINSYFGFLFSPVGYKHVLSPRYINRFMKSLFGDAVKGFSGQGYRRK